MKHASRNSRVVVSFVLALAACLQADEISSREHEPVVGGPCEGCGAVFRGLPEVLSAAARITPEDEPGRPLRITGQVRNSAGNLAAGVIVYAYQTDNEGIYPPDKRFPGTAAERHGRLRAWVETDSEGRYQFDSIRPAGYPRTGIPQHIHMHIVEPQRCTYYIDDIHFDDDPRLSDSDRQRLTTGRGGTGLVTPTKNVDGSLSVTRNIELGANIPDYDLCF